MATVPHVISGLGLRKFQADGFLLTRVYHANELSSTGLFRFEATCVVSKYSTISCHTSNRQEVTGSWPGKSKERDRSATSVSPVGSCKKERLYHFQKKPNTAIWVLHISSVCSTKSHTSELRVHGFEPSLFWDVIQGLSVVGHRRFGAVYRSRLQE